MAMADNKQMIINNTQAIISIVAGTASLQQEYQTTIYTKATCPNCFRTYWTLVGNKFEYLQNYSHCANCGNPIRLSDIVEDPDVIGAEALFLQKGDLAYVSFKLTRKALEAKNLKSMIEKCDGRVFH